MVRIQHLDRPTQTKAEVRKTMGFPISVSAETLCLVCEFEIKVMCFKGTGVCCELCRKALDK